MLFSIFLLTMISVNQQDQNKSNLYLATWATHHFTSKVEMMSYMIQNGDLFTHYLTLNFVHFWKRMFIYRVPFCVIITGTKAPQNFYKLQLHVLGQETFHQLWLNPGLSDLSRNQEWSFVDAKTSQIALKQMERLYPSKHKRLKNQIPIFYYFVFY